MTIEDAIRAIAREVAREELRAALSGGGGETCYSTASQEAWPPGCRSRRMARERIRAVPGHEREGSGPATLWRVRVDAYRTHFARPTETAAPSPTSTDEAIAVAALEAAGLRSTKAA